MKRVVWLAFVFVVFAACAQEETPTVEPPEETVAVEESPAADGPAVEVTEPEDGSTIDAGGVEVTVAPESFEVVDKLGEPPADGEGHVHFYIDVEEADLPTEAGKPAVTADATTYHASATTAYTWPDVDAGEHVLCAQLVNNNHTPLEPAVTDCVTVTVE